MIGTALLSTPTGVIAAGPGPIDVITPEGEYLGTISDTRMPNDFGSRWPGGLRRVGRVRCPDGGGEAGAGGDSVGGGAQSPRVSKSFLSSGSWRAALLRSASANRRLS